MTDTITSGFCSTEFAVLKKAIDRWEEDNSHDFDVTFCGTLVKGISPELEKSIERFANRTANVGKQVDQDARETLLKIDDFVRVYSRYKELFSYDSVSAPPNGSIELWTAFKNLVAKN